MMRLKLWNYLKSAKNDFDFLKEGDIIWARRYTNETQKKKIEEGHRESPYVVIYKTKTRLWVLQCSSKPHTEATGNHLIYPLGKFLYGFHKNTYVKTTASYLLQKGQYIKTLSHLSAYDFNKLKKYIYIQMNYNTFHKHLFSSHQLKWKYEIGDIILFQGQKYYIYHKDFRNYYVYKIYDKSKANNRIQIHNTYYTFQFESKIKIQKYHKIKLIDTLHSGEIEVIKHYQEKSTKYKILEVTIGCLIMYQKKYFYINDENEFGYIVYRIYPSHERTNKMKPIIIKEGIYYTLFEKMVLKNNIECKCRRKAYPNEILENQKLFQMKKELRDKIKIKSFKQKTIYMDDFVPMMIVTNQNNKQNYLILNRTENTIQLTNINALKDTFYFLLEEGNCPFVYYKSLSQEEFILYQQKVKELEDIAQMLCNSKKS